MRYLSIILGFVLFGCNSIKFPDTILSELSDKHFRIKGTKLFIKEIEGFKFYPDVNVLKNSDSLLIQCLFTERDFQNDFDNRNFDFFHNKNYEIVYNKVFTINGLDGVYYKLKEGNSYWLYFIFGDSNFENRIVATYPMNKSFENIVFDFVKSVYYNPIYILNPLESAKFEFDPLNSRFEFVSYSMNVYVFMQKPKDFWEQPNNLCFSQLPASSDTIVLKRTLENFIENFKNNGVVIETMVIDNNIRVDTNFAYQALIKGTFESKPFYNKIIITSNLNFGLVFWITLYNDIEENKDLADSVLRTVKLK